MAPIVATAGSKCSKTFSAEPKLDPGRTGTRKRPDFVDNSGSPDAPTYRKEEPKHLAPGSFNLLQRFQTGPLWSGTSLFWEVEGEIAGINVRGWIDLLDVEGRVIDIKTAKAKPSSIEPMHKFQVATYAHLIPGASGEGRVDTLVKTKTPQIISQSFHITQEEMKVARTLYPAAHEAMQQQHFMPNRLSMMCSRRNCSYWRHCERERGGEVPES